MHGERAERERPGGFDPRDSNEPSYEGRRPPSQRRCAPRGTRSNRTRRKKLRKRGRGTGEGGRGTGGRGTDGIVPERSADCRGPERLERIRSRIQRPTSAANLCLPSPVSRLPSPVPPSPRLPLRSTSGRKTPPLPPGSTPSLHPSSPPRRSSPCSKNARDPR